MARILRARKQIEKILAQTPKKENNKDNNNNQPQQPQETTAKPRTELTPEELRASRRKYFRRVGVVSAVR